MALKIVKSTPQALTRDQAVMAAQRAFNAGDLEAAAKHFLAALEKDPENAELFLQFAIVRVQQDEYQKAVIALQRVLELRPDDVDALNALGVVMFKLGWFAEAEVFFRRVLELRPEHLPPGTAWKRPFDRSRRPGRRSVPSSSTCSSWPGRPDPP